MIAGILLSASCKVTLPQHPIWEHMRYVSEIIYFTHMWVAFSYTLIFREFRYYVQAATARDLFDVASSGILDKFVGGLVNKRRIHNVLSFRGWHSEWNGILQVHYSFLFSFLFSVLKIGFVHFIHDAVHILRGQLSAGK